MPIKPPYKKPVEKNSEIDPRPALTNFYEIRNLFTKQRTDLEEEYMLLCNQTSKLEEERNLILVSGEIDAREKAAQIDAKIEKTNSEKTRLFEHIQAIDRVGVPKKLKDAALEAMEEIALENQELKKVYNDHLNSLKDIFHDYLSITSNFRDLEHQRSQLTVLYDEIQRSLPSKTIRMILPNLSPAPHFLSDFKGPVFDLLNMRVLSKTLERGEAPPIEQL